MVWLYMFQSSMSNNGKFLRGGKCPGGICPRGVIVQGVFVRG